MGSLIGLFLILALFAQIEGANIEILTEGKVVECGKKLTLTSKIQGNKGLVAWMFYGDIVPIARCFSKSCDITKDYVGKYQLDYNVKEGFYNLTIMNVTRAAIGRTFVCTNGHESVSKTIMCKDYSALLFEDAENGIITASSGFISPDTKIVMKWTKIDADDSNESDFNPQLLYTAANMYSNASLGSINHLMHHSVAISAEPSDKGKHYLKLAVTYENETIALNITTLKYNVEEQDNNNGKSKDDEKIDTSVCVIVIVMNTCANVLICISLFVIYAKCRRIRHDTSELSTQKQESDADVSCEEDPFLLPRRRSIGLQVDADFTWKEDIILSPR